MPGDILLTVDKLNKSYGQLAVLKMFRFPFGAESA